MFCYSSVSHQDLSQTPLTLGPDEAAYYTWQDPAGQRELLWSCGEARNNKNDLIQVCCFITGKGNLLDVKSTDNQN